MQDCNKAVNATYGKHARALDKGEFLAKLYLEGKTKYQKAKEIAIDVDSKCHKRIAEAEQEAADYDAKIAGAQAEDKKENQLTGQTNVKKWTDARDNAKAEVEFYKMIVGNAEQVEGDANKGLTNTAALRAKAQKAKDIAPLQLELETLLADSEKVYQLALELWKQWEDSSKSYDCGVPPQVQQAESMCKNGNTKYSPHCAVTCAVGYDGEGTQNQLRCNKQGKFGKELYGEWMGMATCAGRRCGLPPAIDNSNAMAHDVRYPDVAAYKCLRGFYTEGVGANHFTLPCDATGSFARNSSHACKAIVCGAAPVLPFTKPVEGSFTFPEDVIYRCTDGHSVDELPGGLKRFAVHCQATGQFSQGLGCRPIRCGPPPKYPFTKVVEGSHVEGEHVEHIDHEHDGEMFFGDSIEYKCDPGYTIDTTKGGATTYTLQCSADGELIVPKSDGDRPIPKCQPICAGIPPAVPNGKFSAMELCYGDSVVVTANLGYSLTGNVGEGLTFNIHVTTTGDFGGIEKFLPVDCGKPPDIKKAAVKFGKETASFGDLVKYECEDGYSWDRYWHGYDSSDGKSFYLHCEADADYSKAPGDGDGECLNIDDCHGKTCGPHGTCEDHLMNYTCNCDSGFAQEMDSKTGDLHCGNIDDCGPEGCGVGKCVDLINDYKCTCPEGYEQVLEANGEKMDKTCAAVSCGAPPVVDDAITIPASAIGHKSFYTETIVYQCADGHTLDGVVGGKNHFEIHCLASKKFSATKECKPIKCDKMPELIGASTTAKDCTFGKSIKVDCDKGHSIDGTEDGDHGYEIQCQATGKFSEPQVCKPVSCGEPADVPNAFRSGDELVYGDEVEYECVSGFTFDGTKTGETKFKTKCEEHGVLSKPKECYPKVCGIPLPKDVKYASLKDEGKVRYPMSTEVFCSDGYSVDGDPMGNKTFVVRCLASGEFDKYDPNQCHPVICGKPDVMANATLVRAETLEGKELSKDDPLTYHDHAVYKCLEGFTTGGEHDAPTEYISECGEAGHFNPPPEDMLCKNVNDCEGHTCGPKGVCVDLIGPSPSYTCRCEEGYEIQEKDGQKICGNTDDCQGMDCGVGICKDLIGDYTCTCPSGYFIGFKDDKKTCLPVKCADAAPVLENGKLLSQVTGAIEFPRTLRYQCDNGYSIDGTVTAGKEKFQSQCRDDSVIHGMMACQKVSCGTAMVVPFTKLLIPETLEHQIVYEEKAHYECDEGFAIKGEPGGKTEFDVSCPADGHLTDTEVCEPVRCGAAPQFPKSQCSITGDLSYGQTVTYQCEIGYTLDGSIDGKHEFSIECLKTGKFSETDVTKSKEPCQPVYASPPVIKNAQLKVYNGKAVPPAPSRVTYPNGLEYECDSGYTLSGAVESPRTFATKVTSVGKFSPAVPKECKKVEFVIRGSTKDARTGEMLGEVTVRVVDTDVEDKTLTGYFALQRVPGGSTKIKYEKPGYITAEKQFEVTGNVVTGGPADVSMSPEMTSDQWRVVLKWGEEPRDLDSYVKWGANKAWWQNLHQEGSHMASTLEHDDVTSFGPETIHVSNVGKCTGGAYYCDIRYYVNDYTKTGKMLDEVADVTLYTGDKVAGDWHIKDCPASVSEDKMWWHVFTLDGMTNELKWTCLDGSSPAPLKANFLLDNATQVVHKALHLRAKPKAHR
jgi:hypothetical protein